MGGPRLMLTMAALVCWGKVGRGKALFPPLASSVAFLSLPCHIWVSLKV